MARRERTPPSFLGEMENTGQGVSPDLLDRAVWRGEHEPDDAWVDALNKTDRGDKAALLELLGSERQMQPVVCLYLADLVERGVAEPQCQPRSRASGLPDADPWVIAIDAVSEGNKKPLADLLRTTKMPQAARGYLADLIARGIAKPRGKPRVPLYNRSTVDVFLWLARDDVRHRPRGPQGQTVEAALVEAAIRYGVNENSLRKHIEGRREATNRKRKALRPRRG